MINQGQYSMLTVIGPTASGKTMRAVSLAKVLNGEIISGDSRQVYRRMDIGTGKDLTEYKDIDYHLIDVCEAGEKYNLFRFLQDFNNSILNIKERGKFPILCGGTGMYVETALSGIKLPEVPANHELRKELENKTLSELAEILASFKSLHNTTDVDTVKRAIRAIEIEKYYQDNPVSGIQSRRESVNPLSSLIIGIDIPREERRKKITHRLEKRLEEGMIEEVRNLLETGVDAEDLIYYGLEYKYVTLYVIGRLSLERMKSELEISIHQFAKRQMTWFRGMERRGFKINWLPYDLPEEEFTNRVMNLLNAYESQS